MSGIEKRGGNFPRHRARVRGWSTWTALGRGSTARELGEAAGIYNIAEEILDLRTPLELRYFGPPGKLGPKTRRRAIDALGFLGCDRSKVVWRQLERERRAAEKERRKRLKENRKHANKW